MNASPPGIERFLRTPDPLVLTGASVPNEPVLFLPDLMADGRLFHPQMAALSAHRPVHLASLGQGETVARMAAAVLAAAPPRFALVGAGLGGIVALEMLRAEPGRASRVALIATNPFSDSPAVSVAREERLVLARSGRLHDAMRLERTPEHLAPGPQCWAVLATIMEMAHSLGPMVYQRQTRALQRRSDRTPMLRRLLLPVLVLGGQEDPLAPPNMQREIAALTRQAEILLIDDAGHVPTLEQPAAVCDALSGWLTAPYVLR